MAQNTLYPMKDKDADLADVTADSVQTDEFGLGLTPVVAQANITDASVAHALNVTFSDTEVETALDALGTKINAILDLLEAYGLMEPAA